MRTIEVILGEPYLGPTGIWRVVITRDGEERWMSLHTRSEKKARAKIDKWRQYLEQYISDNRPV